MTINLFQTPESAHWYGPAGPIWSVPRADGKGERAPNRGDARKGLCAPSVTGIIRQLAKPELENWKMTGAILSALTLPRLEGEAEDAFAKRVLEDQAQEAGRAAEYGTRVHQEIHQLLSGNSHPPVLDLLPETQAFMTWFEKQKFEVIATEKWFYAKTCTGFAYGGTVDLVAKKMSDAIPDFPYFFLLDFKTRKTVPGKPCPFYVSDGLQLSAYAEGLDMVDVTLLNVVMSTTELGRIDVINWSAHQTVLETHFDNLVDMWWTLNDCKPVITKEA